MPLMASHLTLPSSSPPPPSPPPPLRNPKTQTPAHYAATLRSLAAAGDHAGTLSTLSAMAASSVPLDHFALPPALKSAAALRDVAAAAQLHAVAIVRGLVAAAAAVSNSLITAYARCGRLADALAVFDEMPHLDEVSWNSVISALCLYDEWALALAVLRRMLADGLSPSSFTLTSALLACSNLATPHSDGVSLGKELHAYGLKNGFFAGDKRFASNALIAMYAKLGRIADACTLFEAFGGDRNIVTWNTMISVLVQNDRFAEALDVLYNMVRSGVEPDGVTCASALPACSRLELLGVGKEIHGYVFKNDGLVENSFVASALVDMYCNSGHVEKARAVFDAVSEERLGLWNAMISGYAQNGVDEAALELFVRMEAETGLVPNETTMASVLPACVRSDAFARKEDVHGYVIKRGMDGDKFVQNALMDLYARVGKIDVAQKIFDSMETRDVVSWNTMITGCVVCCCLSEAFQLVSEMQRSGTMDAMDGGFDGHKPNNITLMTLLPACASLAAPAKGKEIHGYAVRHMLDSDVAVGSALADMYAKCGCLAASRAVFDRLPRRNVVTWNVLIMAYGMHGLGEEALVLLDQMAASNEVRPNGVTFIAALAACSHSGMVERGLQLFHDMTEQHGVEPTPDHYACAVDILGRAGQLDEAYRLIMTMEPGAHQAAAWSSLLGACRVHQDVRLGAIAARHLFELDPHEASHYVLLSNIYSAAGLWEEAVEVRKSMRLRGVSKEPGCSWIELSDKIHRFMAGESMHPESAKVHAFLETLWERMRKEGYVPDTSCVLHDIDDGEKEAILRGHSEKLAMAFGLMNTPPGSTIRVAKNLRVCNDCHEAAKFLSKMAGRQIVLRDVRRFHHFVDGSCSCGDYW